MTTLKHYIPLLLLLLPRPAAAQAQPCRDCPCIIARGEQLAEKGDYVNAIRQYNAAKECAPERTAELNRRIEALFRQIEGLRQEAVAERDRAEKALARVEAAERKAKAEAERASAEAQRANAALQKLEKAFGDLTDIYVQRAKDFIFQLHYDSAVVWATEASALQVQSRAPALDSLYFELAYFYNEAGQPDTAAAMTDSLLAWLNNPAIQQSDNLTIQQSNNITTPKPPNRQQYNNPPRSSLRTLLSTLDTLRFAALEKRYYPHMTPIPGGTFQMGSEEGGENERPVHGVTLSPFEMAETETTWWQYHLYCRASGQAVPPGPGWGRQGSHPVVYVRREGAQGYIEWLNARMVAPGLLRRYGLSPAKAAPSSEGGTSFGRFRLPTEAEWEYAARAGQDFRYAGSDDPDEVAWHDGNTGYGTQPVKGKKPNAWGLYDMSGNVWEWCQDWFDSKYYKRSGNVKDPKGPESGPFRVLRGGSWNYNPDYARCAYRYNYVPDLRSNHYGFRLARPVE